MPIQSSSFKWIVVIVCAAILVVALFFSLPPVPFKDAILPKAVDLVAGLFVVVLLVERSLAVINNVWYGEEQQNKEDRLRDLQQRETVVRSDLKRVEAAREAVAVSTSESVAAGPAIEAVRQAGAEIESLRNESTHIADGIAQAKVDVTATEIKQAQVRLLLGFVAALLVAAAGVRALEPLVEITTTCATAAASTACSLQLFTFRAVDILLTAGLIAGGSAGLNAISQLLGSYTQVRQRPQG